LIIFIVSLILIYCVDILLVGLAFHSVERHFRWTLSSRKRFIILFFVFGLLEIYLLPMLIALDITYTVGNEAIARAFEFKPNERALDLFGFGWFEFITWSVQALLAGWVGEKMSSSKSTGAI
jgi:hypothetical protein